MATKSKQNPASTPRSTFSEDDVNSVDVPRPSFSQSSSRPGLDTVRKSTKQKLLDKLEQRRQTTKKDETVFEVYQHRNDVLPSAKKPKIGEEDRRYKKDNLEIISEALLSRSKGKLAIRSVADCLEVTRCFPDIEDVAKGGPYYAARVVIEMSGKTTFQVSNEPKWSSCLIDSGGLVVQEEVEAVINCFGAEYRMCLGISHEEFSELNEKIHINLKNRADKFHPFPRVTNTHCPTWFKIGRTTNNAHRCPDCKELVRYMKKMDRKNRTLSKEELDERLTSSSNFRLSKLTPRSQGTRLKQSRRTRLELREKVEKLAVKVQNLTISLDETQSKEMEHVVNYICKNEVNTLETIISEGHDQGAEFSEIIRQTWQKDVDQKRQFFSDQITNSQQTSKYGNRWSMITYRLGKQ